MSTSEAKERRDMKVLLSGWTRLWIVCSVAILAAGFAHGAISRDPWMQEHGLQEYIWPGFVYGDAEICRSIYGDLFRSQCLRHEDGMLTTARRLHWLEVSNHWLPFWPWLAAPLILGALMLGIGWIRRGFRR